MYFIFVLSILPTNQWLVRALATFVEISVSYLGYQVTRTSYQHFVSSLLALILVFPLFVLL